MRKSLTTVIGSVLVAALFAAGAASLPDEPYQRFQFVPNLNGRLAWIYERIHFDPKPIDVAIVGPSKTFVGVSSDLIEQRLSLLGKRANVVNLSLVFQGRNAQWAILDELYKAKSPRILIVQFDRETVHRGHPWFMSFAPSVDIAFNAPMYLHNYFIDLWFLPSRQSKLFAASLFPHAFGFHDSFDPAQYMKARTDFTTDFSVDGGRWVDMKHVKTAAQLIADHEELKKLMHIYALPPSVAAFVDADNRIYLDRIERLAGAHGTAILTLYLPDFDDGALDEKTRNYYAAYGKILDFSDLAGRNELFSDFSHLNHAGAKLVSERIADAIASQL